MSGGFFRGTSADQDTRFSNKTAKLLKTQKFAPELDQLIDMSKVHLDSLRPWIAKRVTELLGFEDEVLINFIYGLLEGKNVDGKQIQIQLTGFMEKNTGRFMKELWGLLTSAQSSLTGIPQQLLEEKAEEARLKKAEEQRVISEVRRKEDERRTLEQEAVKKQREDDRVDFAKSANPAAFKRRSRSLSRGGKSPEGDRTKIRNGRLDSRTSRSRSRSVSNVSSRSVSRSPPPSNKRRMSRSLSRSPPRRTRRSRSPRRGRSPNYRRRSRSPPKRAWSPVNTRSPRRRRRSYSRSPRRRSPIPGARSPRRRRSPRLSRSPRGRSPIGRSPRRRHSPVYTRSPRRRPSPAYSPRHRRRSSRSVHSPVRRHYQAASPGRRRYSPRHPDMSPRRRPRASSPRLASPSPRPRTRSLSAEAFSKSPPQHRNSSSSPHRRSSVSPPNQKMRSLSPPHGKPSFAAAPHQKSPTSKGRPLRGSVSPVKPHKPTYQHHSSQSPSPKPLRKGGESPHRNSRTAPVQSRALSSSSSSPKQQRSPSLSEASPTSERSWSRSPTARGPTRERPVKFEPQDSKMSDLLPPNRKRSRSSSRESSVPAGESSVPAGERQVAPPKRPSDVNAGVAPVVVRHTGKLEESSSNDDQREASPSGKERNLESDGNKEHGPASPRSVVDKKAAKRRKKEERRLRKEEKRRKREERHKRKEERRAHKALSKGIASVTPPPDFDKRTLKSDDFDSTDEGKGHYDEVTEIEQMKLENELRKKALESIRSKKVASS